MASSDLAAKETLLEALKGGLSRAATFNAQDQTAPVAVLWTDHERQWERVIPRLRAEIPHLLTLGPYAPHERQGPAIWLRCMIDRTLPEATWNPDVVPVLYLPGVSRSELRAIESCPREWQPLAELQYRSVWFSQENTRDWTLLAFLGSSRGGLELDVAGDSATREAAHQALEKLADASLSELRVKRLEAADFHALLQPDLVRELLRWLDHPAATRAAWTDPEWAAFRSSCKERYGFDPERDGELVGAERLGAREGGWDPAWQRFAEAPAAYPRLPDLLRRAKPPAGLPLFFHKECWPQVNEEGEAEVRGALSLLSTVAPVAAMTRIEELDQIHRSRRDWVWARLGHAPLAAALGHLNQLVGQARLPLLGDDPGALAGSYADGGWRVDAAALDALAAVSRPADLAPVTTALRAVYGPWLERVVGRFQELAGKGAAAYSGRAEELAACEAGTCVLFADGLRFDLAQHLAAAIEGQGLQVERNWRLAPLPTVTPTAKPAAAPVAARVNGSDGAAFQPDVAETGQPLTTDRFRKLLAEAGFQDLRGSDTGDPKGRAWTEHGSVDTRGHEEGARVAARLAEELRSLAERVQELIEAGWREVRIVTDHGWLLLPGGLPKVDLPGHLVEDRWTRCATPRPGAQPDVPTVPWYWNRDVLVALAPGIGSFRAGVEYSHGGLSPQECVVPSFTVRAARPKGPSASFESIRWTGLRCRAKLAGAPAGSALDLRLRVGDSASSLLPGGLRPLGADGNGTVVVEDPDREGTAAVLVLLDASGNVVAKRSTTVGGEE